MQRSDTTDKPLQLASPTTRRQESRAHWNRCPSLAVRKWIKTHTWAQAKSIIKKIYKTNANLYTLYTVATIKRQIMAVYGC